VWAVLHPRKLNTLSDRALHGIRWSMIQY
jgi:hypothetical protein